MTRPNPTRQRSAARRLLQVTGVLATAMLSLAPPASAETTHVLVIVGLAGEPEHGELFNKWAASLVDAATGQFGLPRQQVQFLTEKPELDAARATGRSTRQEIGKAFEKLAAAAEEDLVFVMLIGHGTFSNNTAKFNLPGPDMTAGEFGALVKRLEPRRVVFVNTASASGPFIEEVAGPRRTIVTATRNGRESFATIFGGYFVDALTSDAADADKNRRVSVLEAFDYARREVRTAYERQGIIQTEHALLEDNGDKEGVPEPSADGKEGRIAAALSLGSAGQAQAPPASPELRTLHEERRALERRVESLKLMKDGMDPQRYAGELEKLATELARKTRQIREAEGKQ